MERTKASWKSLGLRTTLSATEEGREGFRKVAASRSPRSRSVLVSVLCHLDQTLRIDRNFKTAYNRSLLV